MMFKINSVNRRSQCTGNECTPTTYDILCGKDKTHAKHEGNRLFRERIEAMKESYLAASSKPDKMVITKEIVTHMQTVYGSRFLKMRRGSKVWVEINDLAARDKVSHALRFAARNCRKINNTNEDDEDNNMKNNDNNDNTSSSLLSSPQQKSTTIVNMLLDARDRSSSASSSSSSSDEESDHSQDDGEPIPLTHVFDATFPVITAPKQGFFSGLFSGRSNKSPDMATDDIMIHSIHSMSLRSMELEDLNSFRTIDSNNNDKNNNNNNLSYQGATTVTAAATAATKTTMSSHPQTTKEQQSPEHDDDNNYNAAEPAFDTLRSEDLNEILNEPTTGDEWEVIQQMVEC